jgi:hypothetical protein
MGSLSCAREQTLVSIQVTPDNVKFLSPTTNVTFKLTAIGTYIHPPENKDITTQVTWKSDSDQVATVTSAGVVAPVPGHCGITGITASVFTDANNPKGNVVFGTSTATVADSTDPACPQP